MTAQDIIIQIFRFVDDAMKDLPKHPQASLYLSQVETRCILFALKGCYFRAFYHSLRRAADSLFVGLLDRTRLLRLLQAHRH